MEPISQPKIKVSMVFESFKFKVKTIQAQSSLPIGVIYIDRYFDGLPIEVPKPYNQFIISYIFPSIKSKSLEKSHFFTTLIQNTVYRGVTEGLDSLIYITQTYLIDNNSNSTTSSPTFVIISIPFDFITNQGRFPEFFSSSFSEKIRRRSCYKNFIAECKESINDLKLQSFQNLKKISVLTKQLNSLKNSPEKTVLGDCILCYENPKSTVFLPCGHILSCGKCTIRNLKIQLNRKLSLRKKPKRCPLCNGAIVKAVEIINSKF